MRLIAQDGGQAGVVPVAEALEAARAAELDLVEVMPDADPPVCKLMDYGKYRYKQKRRTHQSKTKSHTTHVKEIRLHPKTSQHDIEYRLEHAREFLTKGDKVLFTVVFSGREMAHTEAGEALLLRIAEQITDIAKIETPPKRDGRRMNMMVATK